MEITRRVGTSIERLSQQLGLSKVVVEEVIRGYLDDITASVEAGEKVVIPGLVTFHPRVNGVGARASTTLKNKVKKEKKKR